MSQPTCLPTDLVLLLSGENRETEIVTVKTQKCVLGMDESTDGKPSCVIFRGPKGATLRSYDDEILINQESKSVHWLALGDRIQFPNSTVIEVQQLGLMPESSDDQEKPETPSTNELIANSDDDQDFASQATSNDGPLNQPSTDVLLPQEQIAELVSEITEIREKRKSPDCNAKELDQRLLELTEQLSSLVAFASSGEPASPETPMRKSADTVSENKERESASTIQLDRNDLPASENGSAAATIPGQIGTTEENESKNDFVSTLETATNTESPDPDGFQPESSEDTSTADVPAETTSAVEPEQQPESLPAQESVADLLERMKQEGQWGGVPDEDETPTASEPTATEPVATQPATEPAPENEGDSESDVDDYMSQLLSRMRGGSAPAPKPAPPKAAKPAAEPAAKPAAKVDPASIIEPLKPEEFRPSRVAKPIESLSAMRELANTTARSAVHSSEVQRLQALAYVQLGIAIASLVMSGYYLAWCTTMGTTSYIIAGLCIGITFFLGIRWYDTMFNQIPFNEETPHCEATPKSSSVDRVRSKLGVSRNRPVDG